MSATAFLSYSRKNKDFALKLQKDLRENQVECWIDTRDISAGKIWDREIEEAIQSCDSLILILSKDSVESDNVLDEVYHALGIGKNIIPIMIEDCKVPYRLSRYQNIDFSKDYSSGFEILLKNLNINHSNNQQKTEGIKPAGDQKGKKKKIAMIALVVSMISSILLFLDIPCAFSDHFILISFLTSIISGIAVLSLLVVLKPKIGLIIPSGAAILTAGIIYFVVPFYSLGESNCQYIKVQFNFVDREGKPIIVENGSAYLSVDSQKFKGTIVRDQFSIDSGIPLFRLRNSLAGILNVLGDNLQNGNKGTLINIGYPKNDQQIVDNEIWIKDIEIQTKSTFNIRTGNNHENTLFTKELIQAGFLEDLINPDYLITINPQTKKMDEAQPVMVNRAYMYSFNDVPVTIQINDNSPVITPIRVSTQVKNETEIEAAYKESFNDTLINNHDEILKVIMAVLSD